MARLVVQNYWRWIINFSNNIDKFWNYLWKSVCWTLRFDLFGRGLGCVLLGRWIWGRMWRWICVNLSGWIFMFFWVDLEGKVSGFGDKFYES